MLTATWGVTGTKEAEICQSTMAGDTMLRIAEKKRHKANINILACKFQGNVSQVTNMASMGHLETTGIAKKEITKQETQILKECLFMGAIGEMPSISPRSRPSR
jgi:predicted transcriptional regulator